MGFLRQRVRHDHQAMRAAAGGGLHCSTAKPVSRGALVSSSLNQPYQLMRLQHEEMVLINNFFAKDGSRLLVTNLQLRNETRVTEEVPTVTSVSRNNNLVYNSQAFGHRLTDGKDGCRPTCRVRPRCHQSSSPPLPLPSKEIAGSSDPELHRCSSPRPFL